MSAILQRSAKICAVKNSFFTEFILISSDNLSLVVYFKGLIRQLHMIRVDGGESQEKLPINVIKRLISIDNKVYQNHRR